MGQHLQSCSPASRQSLGLLMVAILATLGCFKPNPKYNYGPPIGSSAGRQTLAESETKGANSPRVEPGPQLHTASILHMTGNLKEAIDDAAQMPGHQKIFLLLTDRTCGDCLRYEREYLTDPAVQKEAQQGWLFVRGDVTSDKSLLDEYHVTLADLPVVILVSEDGNENGRFTKLPESPQVLAIMMHDRF